MAFSLQAIISAADQTAGAFNSVQGRMDSMAGGAQRLAGILGVTLSAGAFVSFIKGSIDAADRLHDLAQITGTSVETLSGFRLAAAQSGVTMDDVARASAKLSKTLQENPDAFRAAGVSAKDSTGAMIQLADIFKGMPDGIEKTALAQKVFGRSGAEMIPLLNEGSAGLQLLIEKGQQLSPVTAEMARQADLFNDQLDEMKASAAGTVSVLGNALLPTLNGISKAMLDAEGNTTIFKLAGQGIGEVLKVMVVLGSDVAFVFGGIGREIGGIAAQMVALATLDFAGFTAISDAMKADAITARAELDKFQATVMAGFTAPATQKKEGDGKPGAGLGLALGGENPAIAAAQRLADKELAIARKLAQDKQNLDDKHLEMIAKFHAADEAMIAAADQRKNDAAFAQEMFVIDRAFAAHQRMLEIQAASISELAAMVWADSISAQEISELSAATRIGTAASMMSDLIGGAAQHSRAMFNLQKGLALAEAAIAFPTSVMKAYEGGLKISGGMPWVGAAFAAVAGAAQLINMKAIQSAKFGGGGTAPSGGGGGLPGQLANPGIIGAPQQAAIAAPSRNVNIVLRGTDFFSAATIRDSLIPAINEALGDGVTLNVGYA